MNINTIKAICIAIGAFFSDILGGLGYALLMLAILMFADFITGVTASGVEKAHEPNNDKKGIASARGLTGIIKKFSYVVVVGVAMSIDMLILHYSNIIGLTIPLTTFFGSLVTVYFVFNEMVSILENCIRIGVPVPDWLLRVTKLLMIKVDKAADETIEDIEK